MKITQYNFATIALAVCAPAVSSFGVTVAISGTHNLSTMGNASALGLNQSGYEAFGVGSGNDFVSGMVRVSNSIVNGQQSFELSLMNFSFSAAGNTNKTISINVAQDFTVGGNIGAVSTGRQMNGFVSFAQAGQLATGYSDASHESAQLPRVAFNPGSALSTASGNPAISRSVGNTTNVAVAGTYRMVTTYVFTLNAANGVVSINFPDAITDSATLVLVPLEHVAMGAGGALGLAFWQSRRMRKRGLMSV